MTSWSRLVFVATLVLFLGVWACHPGHPLPPIGVVLFAQTVPTTVHAVWNPNPATDNVVSYALAVDGGMPSSVPLSSCSAAQCSSAVTLTTFGSHTVALTAQNLQISTDPTSIQNSLPTTLMFTLIQRPAAVAGLGVHQ